MPSATRPTTIPRRSPTVRSISHAGRLLRRRGVRRIPLISISRTLRTSVPSGTSIPARTPTPLVSCISTAATGSATAARCLPAWPRGWRATAGRWLDWLQSHRAAFRIAGPIVLSGWSAGGHLAALLLDHPCIAAGLAVSGIYELGPIRDTYLNEKLRLRDDEIVTLSPLRLAQSAKPLEIVYGSRELPALVESSRKLHAKRAGLHLPGSLVPAPGHDHFTILETLRDPVGLLARCALGLFNG